MLAKNVEISYYIYIKEAGGFFVGLLRSIFHVLTLGIVDSNEEAKRKNIICCFTHALTHDDFEKIAIRVAKPIKRLRVTIDNEFVIGEVKTTSGINTWEFKLDFNDYGVVTGRYWFRYRDNTESQIPDRYAEELKRAIEEHLRVYK